MRFTTHLIRRGGTFYYRARIPADLQPKYAKHEVWISLKTSNRHDAELKLAQLHNQKLQEYAALRSGAEWVTTTNVLCSIKEASVTHEKRSGVSIDDLFNYWLGQSEKRPRTVLDAKTAVRRLTNACGNQPASLLNKTAAIAFKDSLVKEGLAYATAIKNLGLVKSIFQVAVDNALLSTNVFSEVKILRPARQEKSRMPFTADELERIFSSPVFSSGDRPKGGAGEAAYWLPLIALMTGMRLEEIGQLTADDMKISEGIWCFDLVHEPEQGKHLKNDSSCRQVPVHPKLIELGLLDLISQAKKNKNKRIFHMLTSSGSRQLTASWSQWFGRYLRQIVGIQDKRKCFHSFRHTFKDFCRHAGIEKEYHDRITGHRSGAISDGYGDSHFPLKPLAVAIKKLDFTWIFKQKNCNVISLYKK
jgi:integrase